MKTIKTIIKGILLYSTGLFIIFSLLSIDSIVNISPINIITLTLIISVLVKLCIELISEEDFKTLSGYTLFNKLLNIKDNE